MQQLIHPSSLSKPALSVCAVVFSNGKMLEGEIGWRGEMR
jgi:hypothetical protein